MTSFNLMDVLLISCLLIIPLCMIAITQVWLGQRRLHAELQKQQQRLKDLKQTLHDQQTDRQHYIDQLTRLEQQLHQVNDAQEEINQNVQSNSAYKQALKMIEMGASLDEVVSTCDLARAEAQLLFDLHGYKYA